MTKQELEEKIKELEDMVEARDMALDNADDAYAELEDKLYQMEVEMDELKKNGIRDIDNFKNRLALDGMLTKELEREIDQYLRYYNE
jgi:hypothetical protein